LCQIERETNKKQTCFKRRRGSDEGKHEEKNALGQRDTMEEVKYDAIFCDNPLCIERILESRSSHYRGLFVAYSLTWGNILYSGEWDESEQ